MTILYHKNTCVSESLFFNKMVIVIVLISSLYFFVRLDDLQNFHLNGVNKI